jgi:enamine deaminase RidA (YjgF/YER057c/UK114 family)
VLIVQKRHKLAPICEKRGEMMQRRSVNPVNWGIAYGMDQGEIVDGGKRHLRCSGQVSSVDDPGSDLGFRVVAEGDLRGQIECALSNVDAILEEAEMTRRDIVLLRFFTTDVDGFLENYDVYAAWIAQAGIRPPQSLLGVQRLVLEDLLVEVEMEAVA